MDDTQAAFYATAQCTPDRSSTASFAHALITPARSLSHAEHHCHTNRPPSTAQARKPTHAHTRETACAHATESKACGEKDQVYQAPPRGSSTADAHASIACLFPPHPTPRPRPFEGRSAIARSSAEVGRGVYLKAWGKRIGTRSVLILSKSMKQHAWRKIRHGAPAHKPATPRSLMTVLMPCE